MLHAPGSRDLDGEGKSIQCFTEPGDDRQFLRRDRLHVSPPGGQALEKKPHGRSIGQHGPIVFARIRNRQRLQVNDMLGPDAQGGATRGNDDEVGHSLQQVGHPDMHAGQVFEVVQHQEDRTGSPEGGLDNLFQRYSGLSLDTKRGGDE